MVVFMVEKENYFSSTTTKEHVQVAQSLSAGLASLPATCSSESLRTLSQSWLISPWEVAFPGGQKVSSVRASAL